MDEAREGGGGLARAKTGDVKIGTFELEVFGSCCERGFIGYCGRSFGLY